MGGGRGEDGKEGGGWVVQGGVSHEWVDCGGRGLWDGWLVVMVGAEEVVLGDGRELADTVGGKV